MQHFVSGVSSINCVGSEVYQQEHTQTPLVNSSQVNRLKFRYYVAIIDISGTTCKLEVLKSLRKHKDFVGNLNPCLIFVVTCHQSSEPKLTHTNPGSILCLLYKLPLIIHFSLIHRSVLGPSRPTSIVVAFGPVRTPLSLVSYLDAETQLFTLAMTQCRVFPSTTTSFMGSEREMSRRLENGNGGWVFRSLGLGTSNVSTDRFPRSGYFYQVVSDVDLVKSVWRGERLGVLNIIIFVHPTSSPSQRRRKDGLQVTAILTSILLRVYN